MNPIEDKSMNNLRDLFKQERESGLGWEPSPFLEGKIFRQLEEPTGLMFILNRKLLVWQSLAAGFATFALILLLMRPANTNLSFQASVHTALIVSVEVGEVNEDQLAQIEIDLPDHVTFYSIKHQEIKDRNRMVVAWSDKPAGSKLPFVIRADEIGTKTVHVAFRNKFGKVVERKQVNITFIESKS